MNEDRPILSATEL